MKTITNLFTKSITIAAGSLILIKNSIANVDTSDLDVAGQAVTSLMDVALNWLFTIAGFILLFALIFIGINFAIARKSEDGDKLRQVSSWFKAWVVGAIIILLALGLRTTLTTLGQ